MSRDLRMRIEESEERPKAIASMLQSLNLSSMFVDSMKKLPDAKEIYSEKDFTDMDKIYNESKVCLFTDWFSSIFLLSTTNKQKIFKLQEGGIKCWIHRQKSSKMHL